MGNFLVVCYEGFGGLDDAQIMQGYDTLSEARAGLVYWSQKAIDEYDDDTVMGVLYADADGDYRPYGQV